jgi:hypothetical protein
MSFEQATIKVEKAEEFAKLQSAVQQAFLPDAVESFLKLLDRKNVRIRDFEAVLAGRVLEEVSKSDVKSWALYQALTVSDQAQMREFYLSRLEEVGTPLRHRFKKLYQYY